MRQLVFEAARTARWAMRGTNPQLRRFCAGGTCRRLNLRHGRCRAERCDPVPTGYPARSRRRVSSRRGWLERRECQSRRSRRRSVADLVRALSSLPPRPQHILRKCGPRLLLRLGTPRRPMGRIPLRHHRSALRRPHARPAPAGTRSTQGKRTQRQSCRRVAIRGSTSTRNRRSQRAHHRKRGGRRREHRALRELHSRPTPVPTPSCSSARTPSIDSSHHSSEPPRSTNCRAKRTAVSTSLPTPAAPPTVCHTPSRPQDPTGSVPVHPEQSTVTHPRRCRSTTCT